VSRSTKPAVAARHAQAPGRVRIIGGQWKRTPIPLPVVPGLRPTPDRVRETVFNWLAHLRPDLLAEARRPHPGPPPQAGEGENLLPCAAGEDGGETPRCGAALDLFAGSGALGFEAASRGVARVTLVERDARALAALSALKEKLAADTIDIIAGDALTVAAQLPAASFDLVFLDPPFDSGLLAPALAASVRLLAPDGLIYAESGAPLADAELSPLGLRLLRNDRAGQVFFHLLGRHEA
jgi:16S rRNA (guanine966-N2)-methyltransferase